MGKGLVGISQLREYLQSSGRWREAMLVHDCEEDFYSDIAHKATLAETLIASMDTTCSSAPLRLCEASKRLMLAHFYDELERPEQAEMNIQQAGQQYLNENSSPCSYFNLVIRLLRLRKDASTSDMIDIEAMMKIAKSAEVAGLYKVECIALQTVNAVLTFRRWDSRVQDDQLMKVCERMETMFSDIGYIQKLYGFGLSHHHLYSADPVPSLDWWRKMDVQYPEYNIWQHQITRQLDLSKFFVNHDEFVHALEARQKAEDLLKECHAFWAPCFSESKTENTSEAQKSDISLAAQQRSVAYKNDIFPKYFFEDYQKRDMTVPDPESGRLYYGTLGTDSIGLRKAPFEALLTWIMADLANHTLMPSHLSLILGLNLDELSIDDCQLYIKTLNAGQLIGLLYGPSDNSVPPEHWQKAFTALQTWLTETKSFPEIQQQYMLVELQQVRIERTALCLEKTSVHVEECRRGLELVKSTNFGKVLEDTIRLFEITCQECFARAVTFGWSRASSWTSEMEEHGSEAFAMLQQALSNSNVETSSFRAGYVGTDELIRGRIYFEMGNLLASKFEAGGRIDMARALAYFRFAEAYLRVKRETSVSRHGYTAVQSYLKTLEDPHVSHVFPKAIQIQSTANTARRHKERIWSWVQTAKCRGLGSRGRFYALDEKYTLDFLTSGDDERAGFRVENLHSLSLAAKSPVIFIDWYTNFLSGEVGVPIMLASRSGGRPRLFKFGDDVDNLNLKIYKRHFLSALERDQTDQPDETRTPDHWLQKFGGLLGPIFEMSDPADVLVFSPCGVLHGIPLHAVRFDGQPLIRRNPIVYTTSMRSLFYAAVARQQDQSEHHESAFHSSVFGNAPSPQGRESVQKVASILDVDPNTDADFTKDAFITNLTQDIDVLHYHAHASTQSDGPLEQSLEFHDGPLRVRDILDLAPKPRGYHATILGCSSGVTVKTTSNEPLGLVPALMYNGAASVVSALWPIDDRNAAVYAENFYSGFPRQTPASESPKSTTDHNGGSTTLSISISLARATQTATLALLDAQPRRADLKAWAGFVLNGWWMLDLPDPLHSAARDHPPGLEKFPEMRSARPWDDPPPAPPVRVSDWLAVVRPWFSFYTLWPWFEW